MLTDKNLLDKLVEFSYSLKFEDLPPRVVHETKRRIIDSLGCAIAGMSDPAAKAIKNYMTTRNVRHRTGIIIGDPRNFTPEDAAYVNTHLIRVLDWNDTYLSQEPAHPSDNIGALLALTGYGTNKELITAIVLAYEIQCRFCDAASLRKNGWDHVAYLSLATALATAKILKLNREQMKQAASLALRWIPLRQVRAGSQLSMAKGLSAAEATRFGVQSAFLASHGITGPSEILEGRFGFLKQATGPLDLSAFGSLGEEFKILKTHIKLYPVEYHAQAAIDLALEIRKSANNNPNDIKKINLVSYEACRTIIADPNKRRPTTKESADHSLYFLMAVVILDGKMTLEQYRPERFRDPKVLKLIDCMGDVQEDPDFNRQYLDPEKPAFPILSHTELHSGRRFAIQVDFPKGHWANPLSDKELTEKFKDLTCDPLSQLWDLEINNESLVNYLKLLK
jgi:2-methylcitrate dehydratase